MSSDPALTATYTASTFDLKDVTLTQGATNFTLAFSFSWTSNTSYVTLECPADYFGFVKGSDSSESATTFTLYKKTGLDFTGSSGDYATVSFTSNTTLK